MKTCIKSAFSLIELLVALSVLTLVAAIIVPRFLNIQQTARDVVAQQMASELNNTYGNWLAGGGKIGSNPAPSTEDILDTLTAPNSVTGGTMSDGGVSSGIRVAGISSINPVTSGGDIVSIQIDNPPYLVVFMPQNGAANGGTFYVAPQDTQGNFVAAPGENLSSLTWAGLQAAFGQGVASNPAAFGPYDVNGDGLVNETDFSDFAANWSQMRALGAFPDAAPNN